MNEANEKFWGWRWIVLGLAGMAMFFALVAWAKIEDRKGSEITAQPTPTPTPELKTYYTDDGDYCIEVSRDHKAIQWACSVQQVPHKGAP